MAEQNQSGGRRGHPVKGRNRAGQLRALHAKGVLSSRGKGKDRKTSLAPRRAVIGGSKAAGLRGGSSGPSRESRIAAGRQKAGQFLASERGQRITRGIDGVRKPRRTGRRDRTFPEREKAAKADLKSAGVKVKTGQRLSERSLPRLRGDYSGGTSRKLTPRARAESDKAAAKTARAEQRAGFQRLTAGKPREFRVEVGRTIAKQSEGRAELKLREKFAAKRARGETPTAKERAATRFDRVMAGRAALSNFNRRKAEQQAQADAAKRREQAASRVRRLRGRETRLALREQQREAQRQKRLGARERRAKKTEALDRSRRIKAGQRVLAAFRANRDAQYASRLF